MRLRLNVMVRFVLTLALLILMACGGGVAGGATLPTISAPTPPESTLPAPSTSATSTTTDNEVMPSIPSSQGGVEVAVADLAQRLGVPPSEIVVVSQEEVTWPDGSLGCPQPGMSYIQRLTDGTRVVLEAGGRTYEYHSGGGRPLFYCPHPVAPLDGNVFGDN